MMENKTRLNPRGWLFASRDEEGNWSYLDIIFGDGCAVKIETENFVWNQGE